SLFSSEIESKFNFKEKAPFIDYIGCVIANNNIICYGTNSSYVISSDEGYTWKQGKIATVGTIVKLEYVDSMILGFSLEGHSIKSTDFGKTWQINQLNIIDSAYDVQFDSGYFFVRGYNSICVIDKSFNLISKFKDSILTRSYKMFNTNLLSRNYINIIENYIYFDNTTSKLISLNKIDFINNKIVLDSLVICDTCKNGVSGIIEINGKLIFSIYMNNPTDKKNTLLYEYNTKTKTIKELTNEEFTRFRSKTFYLKNEMYQAYKDYSGKYPYEYFKLNLNKFNKIKDTLESFSTSEILPTSISSVNDLKLFRDSILIAVMSKKTIMISRDLGKNWETISTNNITIYENCTIESDSLKLFYDKFVIFKSFDDNITFKNQVYNSNSSAIKKLSALKTRYIDKSGKIVMIFTVSSDPDNNVAISNDFGKTYEFKNQTLLNYSGGDYNYFNKVDDKFINIINFNPHYKEFNKNYFHFSKYNENMDYLSKQTDSINYIHTAVFKNETTGFLISTLNDSLGGRIEILQHNELQTKWDRKTTQKIKIPLTTKGTFSLIVNEIGISKDSVIIVYQYNLFTSDTTFTNVFLYDNKSEKFETIYQNANLNSKPNIFLDFKSKFIIAGMNFYMENNNRNNLLDWKIYTVKDSSNWSWSKASEDEKYYLVNYSSSTIPASTYKLTLSSSSKIESQTEDQTYFYSYPPFPIPAKNELKSLIYWDMSYNIDDSEIGVYDIYGNKVANREKIGISKLNGYSGYLTWDCSGASTGVYMIQIKHGTNTHNIRAMVVK
ncbi:MAG: sialidase family protein, partial [Candidatus Kapabacteria bacterium]|nr:sialidase family protein [Candidatus Kapabacteria bacterium]